MREAKTIFFALWLAVASAVVFQSAVLVETDPIPPVGLKGQTLPSCPAAQVYPNVYCK